MYMPRRPGTFSTTCLGTVFCWALFSAAPYAYAQQLQARLSLPDAPGSSEAQASNPVQDQSATLSGTVQDANGARVARAQATLAGVSQTGTRTAQCDSAGRFTFQSLPAGTYQLSIASAGLETYVSPPFALAAGQQDDLPPVTLAVATLKSDVQVTATEEQVAEVQIHAEEKQRVLGIAPDFYSSYIWDAAPLDAHQKFVLASKSAFDPIAFLSIGAVAGFEQARNIYPGYHQGAEGYAKRYGASFADEAVGRFFASAIYPSIFRQDPRYFYKGSGTKTQRAEYAISRAFVTRGDNGKTQPNYSLFFGRLTAGAIANLYHDPSDRGAALTFENAFLNIAGHAFDNLAREFLFKRFTPKVPSFENGEASKAKP